MARTRDDIIKQILALTEVANRSLESAEDSTEGGISHEEVADNATRKIAKLMRRHQIDEADIRSAHETKDQKFVQFTFPVSNSNGLARERVNALHWAVVAPFGADSMSNIYRSARRDAEFTVFVPASIAEMLQALLYSVSLQMEAGLKEASRQKRRKLDHAYYMSTSERNGSVLRFRRGYIRAFGATVGSRIKAAQQETLDEVKKELEAEGRTLGSSTELLLADIAQQAKAFMNAWYFEVSGGEKLKVIKNRSAASQQGREAGFRDGKSADIAAPRTNPTRLALTR